MRLSKRGEYALRALIDLGIAQELGHTILKIERIASSEKIPVKFLEQILSQLRRAGYLQSYRGKNGGYSLNKPLREIVIGDVIRLVTGPLAPIACVSESAYRRCSCPDEDHCGLRLLMTDVRTAISSIVDRHTLADVVQVTLRKIRRDKVPVPFLSTEPPALLAAKEIH